MFRKDKWFKLGWGYFVTMFLLEAILPEWMGEENGIIESLQIIWLLGGIVCSWQMKKALLWDWGGQQTALSYAGSIYFFLLTMREISWGRALFINPDGSMIEYSQMGIYGKMVHPMVAVLIIILLYMCYKAKVWKLLTAIKLPQKSFVLLLLFIFMSWVGERTNFICFHGQVAEELAEFGAYMMMYCLVRNLSKRLQKRYWDIIQKK